MSGPDRKRRRARRAAAWALLAAAGLTAALAAAKPLLLRRLAGAWDPDAGPLSPAAQALVDRALAGLDPARLYDLHAHLAGVGTDGSGCEVHPRMLSWRHPLDRARFEAYLSASGVRDQAHGDREYLAALARLAGATGARHVVLALDRHHAPDGRAVPERTEFHVPNAWALEAAARYPDRFAAGVSVHPYRADALVELERLAARGARLVKWLPNAQGIDPLDPRCDPYYARLVELGLVLLSHTGEELAVHAGEAQELGNPLRLRRALDAGVTVVAAHCASLGESLDLDHPARPRVPSFDLFLRLMGEARYEGLLFGELSAVTNRNRARRVLEELLARPELHARLVNGSDWPLPAIQVLVDLGRYARWGMLADADLAPLRELYRANPLLFDLVLKRTLRDPQTGAGLDAEAFLVPRAWGW